MKVWLDFASIVSSALTFIALFSIFIKMGREKGVSEAIQKEMRKDIDENAKDINCLGQKVNQMNVENTKLTTTLQSDLAWIKSSLVEIKTEIRSSKEK